MNNLIHKKVILCLLDSAPKSADEIAGEIGESLATIADQLTALVSENICEEVRPDEVSQYVVRKDVETFAQLVEEFVSNVEEHEQETKQFITSDHYFSRINNQLVNHVFNRFYLDSIYQTDDTERIRRILLVSPSALSFALHSDTVSFYESWSHWNQLGSSAATRDRLSQILCSGFEVPLLEKLIADRNVPIYYSLYTKLQIKVAKISIQVGLATPHEKYVEAGRELSYAFYRAEEGLRPGQWVSPVDPIDFSNDGLALLHLGEFQAALKDFDKALNGVQDPIQKATVLNNKGAAFLRFKQYNKAIECFEEGIVLDSEEGNF